MEILRIVRLTFDKTTSAEFLEIFHSTKNLIRSSEGCLYLRLMQDLQNSCVFYTYSKWVSEEALEAYRNSALFKDVWSRTKILFADKPLAYSLISVSDEAE